MTLILIPGLLSDATVWQEQIKALSHFHILIPHFTLESTPQELISTILAKAPETFFLAGHSMGGWLALELIKHHPRRVKKLCLLATSASLDSPEKKKQRLQYIQKVKEGHFSEVAETLLTAFVYQKSAKPIVRQMFLNNQRRFIPQEEAMLAREESLSILPTIEIPTTVIVGNQDPNFLESSKQIASQIKHANLEIVKESGHMLTIEKPKETTALMIRAFS